MLVQSAEQALDARLRPSRKHSGYRGRPTVASGASAASTEHVGEEAQHDRWTWNAKQKQSKQYHTPSTEHTGYL